jgi:protein-arginine kinase activator protein McsA
MEAEKEKDLADVKFQEWIQNTTNVKQCPNCSTIFEKISGCNRVACASCHTHICWVCLRQFTTEESVMNTLAAFMVVSINHSPKQCDLWINDKKL